MSLRSEHDRERELLLCCARTQASPQTVSRLRYLATQNLDWDYLFNLARRHALIPLLYVNLAREGADLIPYSFLAKLKMQYQENYARNIILTNELCRLIDIFKQAGIEAIPYKGPALALFAYGDLGLRRFVDLDLIVKKSDVPRARDLLFKEDYRLSKPLTPAQQDLLLRTQHNLQFEQEATIVTRELQVVLCAQQQVLLRFSEGLAQRVVFFEQQIAGARHV